MPRWYQTKIRYSNNGLYRFHEHTSRFRITIELLFERSRYTTLCFLNSMCTRFQVGFASFAINFPFFQLSYHRITFFPCLHAHSVLAKSMSKVLFRLRIFSDWDTTAIPGEMPTSEKVICYHLDFVIVLWVVAKVNIHWSFLTSQIKISE